MAFVYGTIPGFCIVYNMALDPLALLSKMLALFIELVMQQASTNTCYSAKLVLPPQLVLLIYISLSSASSRRPQSAPKKGIVELEDGGWLGVAAWIFCL